MFAAVLARHRNAVAKDHSGQLQRAVAQKNVRAGAPVTINRRHYPALVSLKIAGRSDKEISERFGTTPEKIKGHIRRAMAAFQRGKLDPSPSGSSVMEAEEKGKETAAKTIEAITPKLENELPSAHITYDLKSAITSDSTAVKSAGAPSEALTSGSPVTYVTYDPGAALTSSAPAAAPVAAPAAVDVAA